MRASQSEEDRVNSVVTLEAQRECVRKVDVTVLDAAESPRKGAETLLHLKDRPSLVFCKRKLQKSGRTGKSRWSRGQRGEGITAGEERICTTVTGRAEPRLICLSLQSREKESYFV